MVVFTSFVQCKIHNERDREGRGGGLEGVGKRERIKEKGKG